MSYLLSGLRLQSMVSTLSAFPLLLYPFAHHRDWPFIFLRSVQCHELDFDPPAKLPAWGTLY